MRREVYRRHARTPRSACSRLRSNLNAGRAGSASRSPIRRRRSCRRPQRPEGQEYRDTQKTTCLARRCPARRSVPQTVEAGRRAALVSGRGHHHRSSRRRRAGQPRGRPSARRQCQRVERPGARARLAGRRPRRAGGRRGASRPHPPRPARWLPTRYHARHHSGRARRGTGDRPGTDFHERPAHRRALGRKSRPRPARQAAAAARHAGGQARRSAGASLCAPARAPPVARPPAGLHRLAGLTRRARGVCRIPRLDEALA